MSEFLTLAPALVAGMSLGGFFGPFGGRCEGPFVETAGAWFLGSLLVRTSIVLAGFYVVSGGRWDRLLACLLGFVIARQIATRLIGRRPSPTPPRRRSPVMRLSPDELIFWQYGVFKLNATIVFTWALMFVLAVGARLITRNLSIGLKRARWQNVLEIIVTTIEKQIEEVGLAQPRKYLGFLGTLFLLIAAASLSTVIPGYQPPTGSLSTTAALALCVFVAVPAFGIQEQGVGDYLKAYVKPTVIMLPFNIISELSRTLALAVRLFGNMMSGAMIIGILLAITPFLFPIVMTALGLLTGMVQAYIFFILATVYIAAATRVREPKSEPETER